MFGVDIASFQGIPNWQAVKHAGYRFAYVKTTQYPHYVNPFGKEQRQGAFQAGFYVGNYCYCVAKLGDGVAQANHFLNHSDIRDWHLLPFLDLEEQGSEGATPSELETCAMDWGQAVAAHFGVKRLLLYTDQNMLRYRIKVTKRLQRLYMLDLADWTLGPPPNLRGWDIIIQQYDTSHGVPGFKGPVDRNRLFVPAETLVIHHNRTGSVPKPIHSPKVRHIFPPFRGMPHA
jgi:GH25 family lysozyme M1 (1,4-beta-N-acetylmuramidase)